MTAERIEQLAGAINGSNTVFTAPTPYVAGSARVFVNGLLRRQADADGWTETSPAAGTITLAVAPLVGDTVAAYYLDPTTTYTVIVVDGPDVELESAAVGGALSATETDGSIATTRASGELELVAVAGAVRTQTIGGTIT